MAPLDYPEALQGIIWMDQSGFYGQSGVPVPAPENLASFGDTEFASVGVNFIPAVMNKRILEFVQPPFYAFLEVGRHLALNDATPFLLHQSGFSRQFFE